MTRKSDVRPSGHSGPNLGPKLPNFAKQLACQHENLVFEDGAYTIKCRNCEKTWVAMDAFGVPDVSQRACQIFVVDRCQQYRAPDLVPPPPSPAPAPAQPSKEAILQAVAERLRTSQGKKNEPPPAPKPVVLKRRPKK